MSYSTARLPLMLVLGLDRLVLEASRRNVIEAAIVVARIAENRCQEFCDLWHLFWFPHREKHELLDSRKAEELLSQDFH